MKKKLYIIPTTQVVVLQQQSQILAGSGGVRSLGSDEFTEGEILDDDILR